MNSYNKQSLDAIAKEQGFIRDNLEKVIRLVDILNYFHKRKLLSQTLVLKGGTAINLTVFELPRLSVDIDLDFLRKSVIFYLTVGSSRKVTEIPTRYIEFPQIDRIGFPQIRSQLLPVLRRSEHFDFEQVKSDVKSYLSELLVFTENEKKYVEKFNQREYAPELLFDDVSIVERVKFHPMALWKMGKH